MDPLALVTPANIATALIAVNFCAFAAFGIDKARAERGAWRISEGTLLRLAFFGGTPGAYAGRAVFRHKTRKQPFCANLKAIAVLQVIAAAALLAFVGPGRRGWPAAAVARSLTGVSGTRYQPSAAARAFLHRCRGVHGRMVARAPLPVPIAPAPSAAQAGAQRSLRRRSRFAALGPGLRRDDATCAGMTGRAPRWREGGR